LVSISLFSLFSTVDLIGARKNFAIERGTSSV